MARLLPSERSVSGVYKDDRWKEKFAFNVRHTASMDIQRFRTWGEAEAARTNLHMQGYTLLPINVDEDHLSEAEIRQFRTSGHPSPDKSAYKLLKLLLDTDAKLSGVELDRIPDELLAEVTHRLLLLRGTIDKLTGER